MKTRNDLESGNQKKIPASVEEALKAIILGDYAKLMNHELTIKLPTGQTINASFFTQESKKSEEKKDTIPISEKIVIEKTVSRISKKYKLMIVLFTLLGLGTGLMYLTSGEAAGEDLKEQIDALFTKLSVNAQNILEYATFIFSKLVAYGGVATNSILGTQVMMMLFHKIYNQVYRDKAVIYLNGNINPGPWLGGLVAGLGLTITPAYLGATSAPDIGTEFLALVSAILNIAPNTLGGNTALEKLSKLLADNIGKCRNVFAETWDDSEASFPPYKRKMLRQARNIVASAPNSYASYVLFMFIQKQIELKKSKKAKTEEKQGLLINREDFEVIRIDTLETFQKLWNELLLAQDNVNEKLQEIIRLFNNNKITPKSINKICKMLTDALKTGASLVVILSCFVLLLNVILGAFFAGKSLSAGQLGNVLGALSATLAAISVSGLAYFSVKDILTALWSRDVKLVSSLTPAIYIPLAVVLTFIGLFSGGLVALAGLEEWQKIPGLKEVAATVGQVGGFVGGDVFNIPYLIRLAEGLIRVNLKNLSKDQSLKDLIELEDASSTLSHKISLTELVHIESMIAKQIIPKEMLPLEIQNTFAPKPPQVVTTEREQDADISFKILPTTPSHG